MKKNNIIFIVVSIIVVAGSFFGGIQYQKTKYPKFSGGLSGMGERNQMGQRNGNVGMSQVRGTLLNKDENSITVKLQDSSSKIVLFTDSTLINKTEKGTKDDLKEGEEISVFGKTNSDGSVTAENIQVGFNIMRNN
jgi:hypothetical protein